jgi:hypothetical protein
VHCTFLYSYFYSSIYSGFVADSHPRLFPCPMLYPSRCPVPCNHGPGYNEVHHGPDCHIGSHAAAASRLYNVVAVSVDTSHSI